MLHTTQGTQQSSLHAFHIPVMGTGFTIDTPLRVARFGISSAISLVDDALIEQMRAFHTRRMGEHYVSIGTSECDARARRITAYLDLVARLVKKQIEDLKAESFEEGSDLARYFDMLPDCLPKRDYERMRAASAEDAHEIQHELRRHISPGRIEANIMTKLDRNRCDSQDPEMSDAMAALRGFARSALSSALVLSAGINTRLFAYAASFPDFFPGTDGLFRKQLVLKVSDYRSAEIQSRYLAKRGLWVSEYRVESGLNCGGHAFPTQGVLLGPILEEFKSGLEDLRMRQFDACAKVWKESHIPYTHDLPSIRLTVQGGIGTHQEDRLLRCVYGAHSTGWGTPFLLVPEATHVDDETLRKLSEAGTQDVRLSDSSPLGVPYWTLTTSTSEAQRQGRIQAGRPGSPCPKGFLALNQEFGVPLCTASHAFQSRKLKALRAQELSPEIRMELERKVIEKACICHELSGGVRNKLEVEKGQAAAVCPGPNIAFFTRPASLKEMVDHIYGRTSLFEEGRRPHMFLNELALYMDYLALELNNLALGVSAHSSEYLTCFKKNLEVGIEYYKGLSERVDGHLPAGFLEGLSNLCAQLACDPNYEVVAPSA